MIKEKTFSILLYGLIGLILFLFACVGDYNPFADITNAGVYISQQSFYDGDSVEVYSPESLKIIVLLKNETERFTISTENNRYWNQVDTTITAAQYENEPFIFNFSFYDTGFNDILITTHLKNGTVKLDTLSIYTWSPLLQDSVVGSFSDSFTLQTPGVADPAARYYWSFGAGVQIISDTNFLRTTIPDAASTGEGLLWVSDGLHPSPGVPFFFSLDDTTAPQIICVNDEYTGNDTIFTGDSIFDFRVRIFDRSNQRVDSASINDQKFDIVLNQEYHKFFSDMQLHPTANPLQVTVYALDRFNFGNETQQSYTLIYYDSLNPTSGILLTLSSPGKDSSISTASPYPLWGSVQTTKTDSHPLLLQIHTNDRFDSLWITLDQPRITWNQDLQLDSGANAISIAAIDTSTQDTVSLQSTYIDYLPDLPDSIPPRILNILVDGNQADGYYTRSASVEICASVVDDASSVLERVTLNDSILLTPTSSPWYCDSLMLLHQLAGNEIVITARDSSGNSQSRSAVVYRNRIAVFDQLPSSQYLVVDSLYEDSISAIDPDGDSLVFSKYAGPGQMVVTESGSIYWSPDATDTGSHQVIIRAWDGYQPAYATVSLFVSDSVLPQPLKFSTTEEDFPSYLESTADSLEVLLSVIPETGVSPYFYSARLADKDSVLFQHDTSGLVSWKPGPADLGYQQIVITVQDNFSGADTLYPRIFITPPNQPCSLGVYYIIPEISPGVLDFQTLGGTGTIQFSIIDDDNPLIEKHAISIYQASSKSTSVIDSAAADTFRVLIDPSGLSGYDTLITVVTDRGGAIDSVELFMYYGP